MTSSKKAHVRGGDEDLVFMGNTVSLYGPWTGVLRPATSGEVAAYRAEEARIAREYG